MTKKIVALFAFTFMILGLGGAYAQAQGPEDEVVECVSLNLASAEELQALDQVGPVRSVAIVDERDANGEFTSFEDFAERVDGFAFNEDGTPGANMNALLASDPPPCDPDETGQPPLASFADDCDGDTVVTFLGEEDTPWAVEVDSVNVFSSDADAWTNEATVSAGAATIDVFTNGDLVASTEDTPRTPAEDCPTPAPEDESLPVTSGSPYPYYLAGAAIMVLLGTALMFVRKRRAMRLH